MSDYIKVTTRPEYISLYKDMRPNETRPLEHFNGERHLYAHRGKKSLTITTEKLNPRLPATFVRELENFGTETRPMLSDVRFQLTGPKGDLIVYVDHAKYNDDVIRAVMISSPNSVEQKVFNSFQQMRRSKLILKYIRKILNMDKPSKTLRILV